MKLLYSSFSPGKLLDKKADSIAANRAVGNPLSPRSAQVATNNGSPSTSSNSLTSISGSSNDGKGMLGNKKVCLLVLVPFISF